MEQTLLISDTGYLPYSFDFNKEYQLEAYRLLDISGPLDAPEFIVAGGTFYAKSIGCTLPIPTVRG